jgi:hypothetical protein
MNKRKLDNSFLFSSKKPSIKYSTTNTENTVSLNNQKLYNVNDFDAKLFAGETEYNYPDMLNIISQNLVQNENDSFNNIKSIKIKVLNNDFAIFNLPVNLSFTSIFNSHSFNLNFSNAFGIELSNAKFYNLQFPSINVKISNKVTQNNDYLELSDLNYFRQLVCLTFAFLFNLKFTQCSCYPTTINELNLMKLGYTMNCIKAIECNTFLNANKDFNDSIVIGPCKESDIDVSSVILTTINALSLNKSITINQDLKIIFGEIVNNINNK